MSVHYRAADPCPACGAPIFLKMDDEKIVGGELREIPGVFRTCPRGCPTYPPVLMYMLKLSNLLPFPGKAD
jgi:hypothetical protein